MITFIRDGIIVFNGHLSASLWFGYVVMFGKWNYGVQLNGSMNGDPWIKLKTSCCELKNSAVQSYFGLKYLLKVTVIMLFFNRRV